MPSTLAILEIKSARMNILAIQLKTHNIQEIEQAVAARFSKIQDTDSVPLVLDLQALINPQALDLNALLPIFSHFKLNVVGIRHSKKELAPWVRKHGLIFSPQPSKESKVLETTDIDFTEAVSIEKCESSIKTKRTIPEKETTIQPAMVITHPIRTGQQVYAKNADLIVLAVVNQGAEIIADNNIHVYAPLRGRALAGVSGNKNARIFTQCMQAELISIAGVYRTIEQGLPPDIANKPAQISLEQNRLVICALGTK